ncbi:YheC/YheD family protein [Longirhabdus pacifica]|uniref:YheC/YheD family protein n=1 Tax=Longirhabdus pacifica TaxID=2305227 RepID=UPI0010088D09|nr:YheC/YheD family protein [Longirhabdus pacifica]
MKPRRDKMKITSILLHNDAVSPFIPETVEMNRMELIRMLNDYKMVYLKPNRGVKGKGIMKVAKLPNTKRMPFLYKYNQLRKTTVRRFPTFPAMFKVIHHHAINKRYLIQQGIPLLRYNNKITDLRIMVQKNLVDTWEITGIMVKVAVPNRIVTHSFYGAKLITLKQLLQPHTYDNNAAWIREQIRDITYNIAQEVEVHYPSYRDLGIDLGIDTSLQPWILEVNFRSPDLSIFRKFNKKMYRKMVLYRRKNLRLISSRTFQDEINNPENVT